VVVARRHLPRATEDLLSIDLFWIQVERCEPAEAAVKRDDLFNTGRLERTCLMVIAMNVAFLSEE